ncbi:thioredoxin family protein [Vibrio breoganii]|uniref:Thioredoxin family protein n=1 Tax=Vibrio breoganii TaxID=553239 RepID=A0ABX1U2J1_9VIBR|nr:thioredoxin family protein [Vibrio breoganii]NMO74758.1 thioredoxin family protein [Vibrio breoganii]NMR68684.1 thioredoxin family protein [Vibrio breoganii]PML87783.1 thiol reductase thioredoxin [Vibrio breoganii]
MNGIQLGYNHEYSEIAPTIEEVRFLSGYALLEFGAPWCLHCQTGEIVIQQALDEISPQLHIKIFDGKGKKLGRLFSVKLWPTLILLKEGQEVDRIVRPTSVDDVRMLTALIDE